jgi:hypothetical protein
VGASSRAGGRTRLRLGGWDAGAAGEGGLCVTTRRFHRENDLCFFEHITLLQLSGRYSCYNRTGGNDDDERPINGHTQANAV